MYIENETTIMVHRLLNICEIYVIEAQEINDSEKVRKRIARLEEAIEEEDDEDDNDDDNHSSEANNSDFLVIIFSSG